MLNPQQRLAVQYIDGPLLVLAGAGSGKTAVITQKMAWLVRHRGLSADKIAAITFTNKAAREMRERASKVLGAEDAQALQVCTFHALGLRFLHIEHARAGLAPHFSVLDSDDTAAIIKDLAPKGSKPDALWRLRALISRAKSEGLAPAAAAAAAGGAREAQAADVYARYQQRLGAYNAVDFDDLIRLPLAVLEADEEARAQWRERLRYVLVDEYQDTNAAQYQLLRLLAGPRGAFTCVGDDDQSIYAWRGANPENLSGLGRDYPDLHVIKLEQNYRCSQRILRVANALIAHNPHLHPKQLWSALNEGAPVRIIECASREAEAERVAGMVSDLKTRHAVHWHDVAILYRGKHQARALEKALRLNQVPYRLSGQLGLMDRAEVKDLLAYLRLVANPADDAAFLRVVNTPSRSIGATSLEKLGQLARTRQASLLATAEASATRGVLGSRSAGALAAFATLIASLRRAAAGLSNAELAREVLARSGYLAHLDASTPQAELRERRHANLDEMLQWLQALGQRGASGDLAAALASLGHAGADDDGAGVRLMTLHAAKGLEFACVFIVGCEDGTLPHAAAIEEGRVEEERRLLYVGMTRAKQQLTLSWVKRIRRFGTVEVNKPSRFLDELPVAELHWQGRDPAADAAAARDSAQAQLARISALLGD